MLFLLLTSLIPLGKSKFTLLVHILHMALLNIKDIIIFLICVKPTVGEVYHSHLYFWGLVQCLVYSKYSIISNLFPTCFPSPDLSLKCEFHISNCHQDISAYVSRPMSGTMFPDNLILQISKSWKKFLVTYSSFWLALLTFFFFHLISEYLHTEFNI